MLLIQAPFGAGMQEMQKACLLLDQIKREKGVW